jgi:lipopolysaccharide export system permease protein
MVQYNKVYRAVLLMTPELELESNSVKRFKDTTLITGEVKGKRIDDLVILDKTNDGQRRMILAKNALLRDGGKQGLALDLNQAFILSSKEIARNDYDYATAQSLSYWVMQQNIMQSVSSVSVSEMSSVDVFRAIEKKDVAQQQQLDTKYASTDAAALKMEAALRGGPGTSGWNSIAAEKKSLQTAIESADNIMKDRSLLVYRSEFYKKFALPISALLFIFLAVPIGLYARKSGQIMGMIVGAVLALFYWAFLLVGQTLVQRVGYSPFWCIWIADILITVAAALLTLRRVRR